MGGGALRHSERLSLQRFPPNVQAAGTFPLQAAAGAPLRINQAEA